MLEKLKLKINGLGKISLWTAFLIIGMLVGWSVKAGVLFDKVDTVVVNFDKHATIDQARDDGMAVKISRLEIESATLAVEVKHLTEAVLQLNKILQKQHK